MFSLSAVLDSAQASRVLGDLQVTVRVQCDTTIGVSETRRGPQVVVALTKRLTAATVYLILMINTRILDRSRSHLIHLETHPVVDLIVGKCYVILEGGVPGHAI
jgi:hypothetical protein